jgi:hypothetical protein
MKREFPCWRAKKTKEPEPHTDLVFKPGSTADKVISLIEEGFFDQPRTIGEMISEFKAKDYHFKPSDLTLPLRKIVQRGFLKRSKINADGTPSTNWLFVKV